MRYPILKRKLKILGVPSGTGRREPSRRDIETHPLSRVPVPPDFLWFARHLKTVSLQYVTEASEDPGLSDHIYTPPGHLKITRI